MNLQGRIDQFKADSKNLFSFTECIMVALLCPDLYLKLMPKKYLYDPVGAQMQLNHRQRNYVWNRRTGLIAGWEI